MSAATPPRSSRSGAARPRDVPGTVHKTACILCSLNCGIEVEVREGRLARIRGDKAHPVSRGYVCEKAQRLNYYQTGADRLEQPLRRRPDGSFEAIDWDTAIGEVAARLGEIKSRHGGESIFYFGGGGQGNHLCGAYADATLKALGSRYRSNALAQEKTGEFWVNGRMFGVGIHGDFEHCQVAVFIGKNPWQSHGFARSRPVLKQISRDPNRSLVVIDPRRSETAAMADHHLALRPGTDAWCLAALAAILVQEGLIKRDWLADHAEGLERVEPHLADVPVAEYAGICGVPESQLRRVARLIAGAGSVSVLEDLGMQMSVHSTLGSYLQRLVWVLTGHFGRQGTNNSPVPFLGLNDASKGTTLGKGGGRKGRSRVSPVVGARIITGLVPCNVISEEILTDHPKRYRAMLIESGNPVHSLADSQKMREALRALDLVVVIDVAMTETAREADYVLPVPSQFEKAEATFFNLEVPHNAFHLRRPVLPPRPGTLPEAEIHARLVEALGELGERDLAPLRRVAKLGSKLFAPAFFWAMARNPRIARYAPVVLYRTLGPTLPPGMETAAVLWGLAHRYVRRFPREARAAGFGGLSLLAGDKLFAAILNGPSGVVFADGDYQQSWERVRPPGNRINLEIPELLPELDGLRKGPPRRDADFPFILSAGERRSETTNTIVRNPVWAGPDMQGALRLSPQDADNLELRNGDMARLSTRRGSALVAVEVSDMMQRGHVSLPNGLGLEYADSQGAVVTRGVAPNELTSREDRDFLAGTPWHKHVPARVEKAPAT